MRVPIDVMRVCKSHEVALEEVEWTNTVRTGHEESACRGHESNCKDHGTMMGVLAEACEFYIEAVGVTFF
jgi:hypothetical protein